MSDNPKEHLGVILFERLRVRAGPLLSGTLLTFIGLLIALVQMTDKYADPNFLSAMTGVVLGLPASMFSAYITYSDAKLNPAMSWFALSFIVTFLVMTGVTLFGSFLAMIKMIGSPEVTEAANASLKMFYLGIAVFIVGDIGEGVIRKRLGR